MRSAFRSRKESPIPGLTKVKTACRSTDCTFPRCRTKGTVPPSRRQFGFQPGEKVGTGKQIADGRIQSESEPDRKDFRQMVAVQHIACGQQPTLKKKAGRSLHTPTIPFRTLLVHHQLIRTYLPRQREQCAHEQDCEQQSLHNPSAVRGNTFIHFQPHITTYIKQDGAGRHLSPRTIHSVSVG